MSSTTGEISRLLVRPPNWLGDAVLALPAVAALRQAYPEAHLTIAAAPSVAAIFREVTEARPDQVIDLSKSSREAIAALRQARERSRRAVCEDDSLRVPSLGKS